MKVQFCKRIQLAARRCIPKTTRPDPVRWILTPDGDVYPYRRIPISVGDVLRSSLRDIDATNTLRWKLRDRSHDSTGCTGCDRLARCRSGLKCLSYAETGSPFERDPGCWMPDCETRLALSRGETVTCSDNSLG